MERLNITQYYQTYASSIDKPQHMLERFASDITIKKANKRLYQIERSLTRPQRDALHYLYWARDKEHVCDMLLEIIDVEKYTEEADKIFTLSKYQMCIAIAILDTNNILSAAV